MKLTKISTGTYSFLDAVVVSVYNKQDKTFSFTVERIGFNPTTSIQKNILTMDTQIESIYNSMTEVVNLEVDIDADLSDYELALAEFIRSYNPQQEDVVEVEDIGETQDEILMALNQFLSTESDEDYSIFKDILNEELAEV
jgi:hypothetical protein